MPFLNNDICGMVQALHLHEHSPPTYIPVPLTSVNLQVRVVNFTAQVEVEQEFVNKEAGPIECVYFFPVEEEAAVINFTAELEGKTIKTEVKEKEEARQEYKTAVRNRQTAFLLEETKPDVFEIKVGHLSPGAGCKICITYLCELPVEDGKTRLTIPTTVAPRYKPSNDTSEEARKIASIQHDFKSPVKMIMDMDIVMKTEIIEAKSPSHSLTTMKKTKNGEYFQATLNFAGNTTDMDRDLVVLIETDEPYTPKVMIEKDESSSEVAMLSFVPQFQLKEHQVEAVFLVDCSGSMRGRSMDLAKEALQVFLHSLPVTSYFNIIMFGSTFRSMFSASRKYDDETLNEAKRFVQNISANLGGTEIYQPLEHIFKLQPQTSGGSQRPRQVFVLTDGQVSNSTACIKLTKTNSSTNRVFTLGIGSSADRHLVKGMARAGQGTPAFTTEGESITAKVIGQLKNALQPCISEVKIQWGKQTNIEGLPEKKEEKIEMKKTLMGFGKPKKSATPTEKVDDFNLKHQAPRNIPAIYDGSRLLVYKLIDKTLSVEDVITVKAATPEGELELSVSVNLDSFIEGDAVHKLFARKTIQHLEEMDHDDSSEKKKFITEVGLKYQLASKYTSFVGIDDKQNKETSFMMTRHVKNQLPHNSGYQSQSYMMMAPGCAAPGSAAPMSFGSSVMDYAGSMAPPGAAAPRMRDRMLPPGSPAPRFLTKAATMSSNCVVDSMDCDYASSESEEDDDMGSGIVLESCVAVVSNKSKVVSLTSCQLANGSFTPSAKIAATLEVTLDTLLAEGRKALNDAPKGEQEALLCAWTTAVVVAFLKELCQKEKDVWELVVDKAERWLQSCATNFSKIHMEKAGYFIKSI